MAERKCFIATGDLENPVIEEFVEFKFYPGFALENKQKSIESFHNEIAKRYDRNKILEVSTKSNNKIGVLLSAFNLSLYINELNSYVKIENIFQSSKVFDIGGPYRDLLTLSPNEAKSDSRIRNSGNIKYFDFQNTIWNRYPKTMFYDWLYINALRKQNELAKSIEKYSVFTDIEFNHKKSINCQARAAALFVSLLKNPESQGILNNTHEFIKYYERIYEIKDQTQLDL